MSYNKAQFQVAFKPTDLIDNLKSAQIAALGRDRTIAELNKMSNLENPWKKLTAYAALGRFAQQYQHEKIEALGGAGTGELQKQYMRDVSSYLEQKTAHAKKERDIVERIREADVYGLMSAVSGMENIEEVYAGGEGLAVYPVELGEGEELAAEMGSALAAAQARSEFGLELEQGRERFSTLLGELRGAMASEAQQGSLSEAPAEAVEGGRRKKIAGERKPRGERSIPEEMSFVQVRGGRASPGPRRSRSPFMSETEQEQRDILAMQLGREPSQEEFSRRKKLGAGRRPGRRAAGGIASFEEAIEEGPSWSYFDQPASSGGSAALDPSAVVYEFIAENPAPERALRNELEAWEEHLVRLVARGGKPIKFQQFKKEFYMSTA